MLEDISLPNIRAFVSIAEAGSFTTASENLGVSRSHLSRQLSSLEKRLGIELIVRTTRSQRLTDTGKIFFEKCRKALQAVDQAIVDLVDETEQLRGDIRINCVGGIVGEEIVTPIIAEFSQLYPDINIELDFSSSRVDMIGEGFDLVIRMGELEDSSFVARKLIEITIGAYASPEYISGFGNVSLPKQLSGHNCLTGSVKNWQFHRTDGSRETQSVIVNGNFESKNG